MSRRAPLVVLSPEEHATLQSWAKARSQPQRLVQRAQVVLMAAEGIGKIAKCKEVLDAVH